MNNIPVTVAFIFHERLSTSISCLKHLIDNTPDPYELICVDPATPESIASPLRELAAQYSFTLIRSDEYLSPNESRNLALQHVRTRYVVFVDNDVKVGRYWLDSLVRCAEETGAWLVAPLTLQLYQEDLRVHMFGGTIHVKDDEGRPAYVETRQIDNSVLDDRNRLSRQKTGLIELHTVLMNTDAYRKLGPLDDMLFNSVEHVDLSLSVKNANKEIYLEPASVVTLLIPHCLEPVDRDYFALRWSEAWTQATLERLAEKYSIPLKDRGLRKVGMRATEHRQRLSIEYPRVRSWSGTTLYKIFLKVAGRPLETRQNLRLHPLHENITNRNIYSEVISD